MQGTRRITYVAPASPAYRAGVAVGDAVLQLNDTSIADIRPECAPWPAANHRELVLTPLLVFSLSRASSLSASKSEALGRLHGPAA